MRNHSHSYVHSTLIHTYICQLHFTTEHTTIVKATPLLQQYLTSTLNHKILHTINSTIHTSNHLQIHQQNTTLRTIILLLPLKYVKPFFFTCLLLHFFHTPMPNPTVPNISIILTCLALYLKLLTCIQRTYTVKSRVLTRLVQKHMHLLSICTGILGIFDIPQFEISSLIFFLV